MPDQVPQRGLQPANEVVLLQAYLYELGYLKNIDGVAGPQTSDAVRRFQAANGLVVDGVAGEKTWTKLFALKPDLLAAISAKWLSQDDLQGFATKNQLPMATVKAVYEVESGGTGFWGLRPKILFEGHVFWQVSRTLGWDPNEFRAGNEDILYPTWDNTKYLGGIAEYARLDRARAINQEAADRSTSWGLFQILGQSATDLGYEGGVEEFVDAMNASEREQLDAFGRFVAFYQTNGYSLLYWLQQQNWEVFAARYNGPRYKVNRYDTRLQQAFDRASRTLRQ